MRRLSTAGLLLIVGLVAWTRATDNLRAVRLLHQLAHAGALDPASLLTGPTGPAPDPADSAMASPASCRGSVLGAKVQFLAGDAAGARDRFESLQGRCDLTPTALLFRGLAGERTGHAADAARDLEAADAGPFFFNSALAGRRLGRCDEAVEAGTLAVRLQPASPDARVALAEALISCGRADEAPALLHAAVRLAPESAKAHYWAGWLHRRAGDTRRAMAEWTLALRTAAGDYRTLVHLADALREEGDVSTAAELYRRAETVNPDGSEAGFGLGRIALQQGRFDDAAARFRAAAAKAPGEPGYVIYLARALRGAGDTPGATRAYERAWALASSRTDLRWYRLEQAEFLAQAGAVDDARAMLEELRTKYPGTAESAEARRRLAALPGGPP